MFSVESHFGIYFIVKLRLQSLSLSVNYGELVDNKKGDYHDVDPKILRKI